MIKFDAMTAEVQPRFGVSAHTRVSAYTGAGVLDGVRLRASVAGGGLMGDVCPDIAVFTATGVLPGNPAWRPPID